MSFLGRAIKGHKSVQFPQKKLTTKRAQNSKIEIKMKIGHLPEVYLLLCNSSQLVPRESKGTRLNRKETRETENVACRTGVISFCVSQASRSKREWESCPSRAARLKNNTCHAGAHHKRDSYSCRKQPIVGESAVTLVMQGNFAIHSLFLFCPGCVISV